MFWKIQENSDDETCCLDLAENGTSNQFYPLPALISNWLQTKMSSPATSIPSLLLWTDVHASAAVFTPPLLVMELPPSICNQICCGSICCHELFQILLSLTSTSLVSILAWAALALLALVVGSRLYVYIMVVIVIVIHLLLLIIILILLMIILEGEPTGEAAKRRERGSTLRRL